LTSEGRFQVRKASACAAIGALLFLVTASGQAEVTVNQSIDISLQVFVPCANGGAGEVVDLNGPLHVLLTATINGNRISGVTHFQPQGISGVGEDTGAIYQGTGVTQDHFSGSLTNGQFSETFVNNFRIVGQGPGNNFQVHEDFHLTITANGDVTSSHHNIRADCN